MASTPRRMLTATALFDGHDAALNLIRRLLVDQGAEVIHLGHDRSVTELVKAAREEDADGLCISSYQGGHLSFYPYLVSSLAEGVTCPPRVFGGGGGVILPQEIEALEAQGVARIYSPAEGQRLGLQGMVADLLGRLPDRPRLALPDPLPDWNDRSALGRALTTVLREGFREVQGPVVGLTGTGGAGKSCLVDELIQRLLAAHPGRRIGVLALDPTRRRSGGALLGDRLRVNQASRPEVFYRSLASGPGDARRVRAAASLLLAAGADLVLVETPGIGQGDVDITEMADLNLYVMTPEFGAATQLEKINMLDLADLVVVNKCEDARGEDALLAVRRQVARNRNLDPGALGDRVVGTVASRLGDPGVDDLARALGNLLEARWGGTWGPPEHPAQRPAPGALLPTSRRGHLGDVVQAVRTHRARTEDLARRMRRLQALERVEAEGLPVGEALDEARKALGPEGQGLLDTWHGLQTRQAEGVPSTRTLSGLDLPKVTLPRLSDWGEVARFLRREHLPGHFPFTAGVFPYRRTDEDPKRQFAGEGDAARTNRRFHLLCEGESSRRLSVAFDSVTLYGRDPDPRPDILGKVGESGVSIATLDDMKTLFQGFDLTDPRTSVSMTINGPAPILLAMFLNTAIDQRLEAEGCTDPAAQADLRARVLREVRGTVQADILKEDQAQNTCIFSVPFALRLMGDVQAFLAQHRMRNYYGVSISGYHIAEAGADPVTQLAFTLANGFTLLEFFLARGLTVEEVAPNLSFFFSSGLDPEYAVMGRVARRLWAVALKEVYGASDAACRLKYHVQTSGRSLHLKEMDFNDIRTTIQAFTALTDNCNSLHTNAFDEALTTPTEDSVRRAMAIQLILTRESGLYRSENLLQGSHFMEALTDQVEEAVLELFNALHARGGVLGAMETQFQRLRIQEQSHHYEQLKHSGELPVVGVNTFLRPGPDVQAPPVLSRATDEEKAGCLARLRAFQDRHADARPAQMARLQAAIQQGGNVFEVLMDAVRVASLGQITNLFFDLGGRYRRAL